MPFAKDGGDQSTTRKKTTANGNIAPMMLKHLSAHAIEPLQSSVAQQGISALFGIDISMGFAETTASPFAGTRATEIAIRAAKIVRMGAIQELSVDTAQGSITMRVDLP
jgi:hypothetical protein